MEEKNLYLVRGLPGAGKTTFSKSILHEGDLMIAADDFMINEKGEYLFDVNRLQEVHDLCAKKVFDAMETGVGRIFVHNTLTEKWEVEKYYTLAKKHSYRVFSIILENRHRNESNHGISSHTLGTMRERFEIEL
jgi:ABC-type uncharacterized transport system ATPase subunit